MTYLESVLLGKYLNTTYPHCDPRVLHAPGECQFCDMHAAWQRERVAAGVLFTNDPRNERLIEEYLSTGFISGDLRPCPGVVARGMASITAWGGNRAKPEGYAD